MAYFPMFIDIEKKKCLGASGFRGADYGGGTTD